MTRVLLIDLENCPNQINQLLTDLEQFSQIIICYAQSGPKIPLEWVTPLSAAVSANTLTVMKMPTGGKNAADFGICFFAGVLMERLPVQTHFVIVSEDTDLDHVVRLLKSQGRTAERINTKKVAKPEENDTSLDAVSPLKAYCMHLMTHSKNRPAKEATLINSMRNMFQSSPAHVEHVLGHLKLEGAVTFVDNKVSYNNKKITELSK
jgi:hypothetical protein